MRETIKTTLTCNMVFNFVSIKKIIGKCMNKSIQYFALVFLFSIGVGNFTSAAPNRTTAAHDPFPTPIPDHIILTWSDDPATSQSVTWRTDTSIVKSYGEIAQADASPNFIFYTEKKKASAELLLTKESSAYYYSVTFSDLQPNTLYIYRIGSEDNWSEWFQFRTACEKPEPFSFIYLGDGQNALLSLWSRAIRAAYSSAAPDACFIIHAGDLVANADSGIEFQ